MVHFRRQNSKIRKRPTSYVNNLVLADMVQTLVLPAWAMLDTSWKFSVHIARRKQTADSIDKCKRSKIECDFASFREACSF